MPEEPAGREQSRYETLFKLASGGMATVFVGTVRGAFGFRQLVAIKKPHKNLLANSEFRQALLREARLASLIHHANVVDVRDVEATDEEVSLVMDYVEGATLSEILDAKVKAGVDVPPGAVVRIVLDACAGLHAAHEQTDERGRPLRLVHRDISPQNLLVGVDGLTRVADFGVAKFKRTDEVGTMAGVLKGKLAYMAPEYVRGASIDRRLDVFAMGVVLWEALTGRRLFRGSHEGDTLERVLSHEVPSVATIVPALGTAFDAIVETALAKDPDRRFSNAAAMAAALESSARAAGFVAGPREVADLVKAAVGPRLEERRALIRARLAHEPSVASVEFEPGVAARLLEEAAPPGSTTLVDHTPSGYRREASTRIERPAVAPTLNATLRSEAAAVDEAAPLDRAPRPPPPAARVAAVRIVDDEAVSLPMKGGKSRYGLLFVVITVAVAAAVVGIAQLRGAFFAPASSVSPSSTASSSAVPPVPRASSSASVSASASTSAAPSSSAVRHR
jgi:serine/threonine-protein kinase